MPADPPGPPPDSDPVSAADWRALADRYEGKRQHHLLQAELFAKLRDQAVEAAKVMDRAKSLRISGNPGIGSGNMVVTHRLAISKGRTGEDPFAAAYRAAGFTMKTLAKRLHIPRSLLSMYRMDDGRPIPRDRAAKIEKLTGWPADAAHWPNKLTD